MDRIVNSLIIIKTFGSVKMHKTIYFLKRLGVLHNISISFQPYDERRSCNVVETEFLANYTVFVSLALIPSADLYYRLVEFYSLSTVN